MEKLWVLYQKHREVLLYLFAGGLTTIVNYATYLVCAWLLADFAQRTMLATGIAWALSVLFAYVINRSWVFRSQTRGFGPVCRELGAFLAARVFSGVLDLGIMYAAVDVMRLNDKVIKLASNVLVVVINHIFSKMFIFKRQPESGEETV